MAVRCTSGSQAIPKATAACRQRQATPQHLACSPAVPIPRRSRRQHDASCSSMLPAYNRRRRHAMLSVAAAASERDPLSGGGNAGGSTEQTDGSDSDSLAAVADRLSLAIAAEDYQLAAQLRDELGRRSQDGREAVLDANQRFYDAFQSCDPQAMAAIWGEGEHIQCIHPVSGVIAGRDDVLASWEMVLGASGSIEIRLAEVRVALLGERSAFITCTELIDATDIRGRIAATNVFENQNGEWRIVLHHGSPSPPPQH